MADVIELSSDSDNSSPSKSINYDSDTSVETDLTDILKQIGRKNDFLQRNDSDDELYEPRSLLEKLRKKYSGADDSTSKSSSIPSCSSNSLDLLNNEIDDVPKVKKAKLKISEGKLLEKERKEKEKADKQAEKEKLKIENAKNKAAKQAMIASYKNLKPEESLKLMTTIIDSNLISDACGQDIPVTLQTWNISYKIAQQIHPFTISWSRKTQSQLSTIDGQLSLSKNDEDCNEIILIMLWKEIVDLIHEKQLRSNVEIKHNLLPGKKIHLGIYGLEQYFKNQKLKKCMKNIPIVSRKDVEMALIELQIYLGLSHRLLETPQDVSNMVAQFTKSIAQIPYKLHKQQKEEQMDWFVAGDNKDCVRVDKSGNGLLRLWQQQLTQFTLARLETAEAITSKYPSPTSLMQAYEQCLTKEEGEKLLQDIPIRRAAGPLTSVRKIGPELSKKIHTMFTSTDGNAIL